MSKLTLNYCKQQTMAVCKMKGWDKVDVANIWMYLVEEIGELAGAIRRGLHQFQDRKRTSIQSEIMDVLSYLFQIAHDFDIDLDAAWVEHMKRQEAHASKT